MGGAAASGAGIACMVSTVGIVSAVGYSSYWITDTYINPWLQPIIRADSSTKRNKDEIR